MSGMRVGSCLAGTEVEATDSEKEINKIPSLAKVTSKKQQMFTSEEVLIRIFIGLLSFDVQLTLLMSLSNR